jgi:hypothetical protein
MSIIRLDKLLKSGASGILEDMVQNAQYMDQLTSALRRDLPVELADQLIAASLRADGELVLIVTSSAWASKFRFETGKIMEILRKTGAEIKTCRVTVSRHGTG